MKLLLFVPESSQEVYSNGEFKPFFIQWLHLLKKAK